MKRTEFVWLVPILFIDPYENKTLQIDTQRAVASRESLLMPLTPPRILWAVSILDFLGPVPCRFSLVEGGVPE